MNEKKSGILSVFSNDSNKNESKENGSQIQDEEFKLSEYYKERLEKIIFEGEIRAEKFATYFRFALYGLLCLFSILSWIGGRPLSEFQYTMSAIGLLIAYNTLAIVFLNGRVTEKSINVMKYMSTFLEISVLSFLIAFLTYSQGNTTLAFTGAMGLLYFLMVALASIRNDKRVIIFAFSLAALEYGGIMLYYLPAMKILNQHLISLTETVLPSLAAQGGKFTIVSTNLMSVILKLLYLVATGSLIVYSVRNSQRTARKQSGLIFNTEKEAILKEKEKSDYLLLNILPQEVAQELKDSGKSLPKKFKAISVLFTDFKGFTKIAEMLSPEELVNELDFCFRKFDEIIEKHGLEKIKTIGDSYMCAGGLPRKNTTHAVDCVLAAIEIQNFMQDQKDAKEKAGRLYWEMRIGIHTGTVIAGVVGKKKFAYDIWGDTVNTASRLESSGVIGRVNISDETFQLVKDFFVCQFRGEISAKNKGDIKMHLVFGIKPELSVDGKGLEPNDKFYAKLGRVRHDFQYDRGSILEMETTNEQAS